MPNIDNIQYGNIFCSVKLKYMQLNEHCILVLVLPEKLEGHIIDKGGTRGLGRRDHTYGILANSVLRISLALCALIYKAGELTHLFRHE